MGLLSGLVGIGSLVSNFVGGGAGSKTNTTQNQNSTTTSGTTATSNSNANQSNNSRSFSDSLLGILEPVTQDALGSTALGQSALRDRLDQVSKNPIAFDADAYVKGIMEAATSAVGNKLNADVNGVVSSTGGSTGGNSAAALLANRLRTEASSNLAGINSTARGQAVQIENELESSKSSQITGLTQNLDAGLTTLLSALKGGETQTNISGVQNESQSQSTTGTTTGTTAQSQVTPFNWSKAFGNIFSTVNTDK